MKTIFNGLSEKPQDQIFGLYQEYLLDKRDGKINLGIGTYRKPDGSPYVLDCIKQAEKTLSQNIESKEYLPIDGDPHFIELVSKILFEKYAGRFVSVQTPGGAVALTLTGELLREIGIQKVAISDQTWINHLNIFNHLKFQIERYPYYDPKTKGLRKNELLNFLKSFKNGALILQPACHNPTGVDIPQEMWEEIFRLSLENNIVPIFDVAYLGMKSTFTDEMWPVYKSVDMGLESFVTTSFSKNFGLYAERIGLLSIFTKGDQKILLSNLKNLIRAIYSNPPQHGSLLINEVLQNHKNLWLDELRGMRDQIKEARLLFKDHMHLDYVTKQVGMFSLLDLSGEQINRLKTEFAIYLPTNGRINFAAINSTNIEQIHHGLTHIT